MAYSSISKPSLHFNTVLYTSNNGTSPRTISGVGFQPDFVLVKNRDDANYNHVLNDSVRGLNKILNSDTSGAELAANHAGGYISSANSDGFVVTAGSSNLSNYDTGTNKQVVWNWLASNSTASNTDGSITSTVSANTTSGFSIVKYDSTRTPSAVQTVGHGLGVSPDVLIFKNLNETQNWLVWHKDIATDKHLNLNTNSALNTDSGSLNNTAPTSSVFTIGADGRTNSSTEGNPIVCYAFAEKKGFSKFGSYTGNGNADGTFIYTGFKPAFILSKKSSGSGTHWTIWDNKRSSSGGNPTDKILHPNVNNAENTADDTDFLSNGFKLRATASGMNNSGDTYIFMAFAAEPLVANVGASIPATAR